MRRLITLLLVGSMLTCAGCAVLTNQKAGRVVLKDLRCEYLTDPLGIDVVQPRLNWVIESDRRGWKQTAYQILVAAGESSLLRDQGDLWDTGRVESGRTAHIVYTGSPLKSRMQCYWKVRVWDGDGEVSAWSEPACWTMGLLREQDWQAEWIGYDAEPPAADGDKQISDLLNIRQCKWVWFPEGEPQKSAPVGTRYFRREFEIPQDSKVLRAFFHIIVDNEATLFVNGRQIERCSGWTTPHTFDITDRLKPGINTLAVAATNQGDSPNPAALAGRMLVEFESGDSVAVAIDASWKVCRTEQDGWRQEGFDDTAWASAKIIADCGDSPWGEVQKSDLKLPPPSYLRKAFSIAGPVKHAVVYASALGLYELHINGSRVGEDYFTPGWTDYNKRVYYQAYDVTNLLTEGDNAVGAILADGWYAGYVGFGKKREHYGDKPRLLVRLEIEYADGSGQTVATDSSWRAAFGPLMEADFLMGETCDARREMPGWTTASFDDSQWRPVAVTDNISAAVQSYPGVTVRRIMHIEPKKLTEPKRGVYVFDLGQNFAGWARLKVKGKSGTKVVMRFAEMLNPDSTVYTTNLRQARCTNTYILKGRGVEVYEPRFTYHGFRYVEVTGFPGRASLGAVTGVVVHSDTPVVGSFECSDPMVNQLYSNITWGQRSNFVEVPTDCPQRDERLGWTGDAQIFIRTATYNMDVAAFFTKWLIDLEDAQTPEGAFPDVAPHKVAMGSGVPAWGDAGTICPWTMYQVYGDRRVLEKHYESMKKWIDYLKKNSKDLLRPAYGYGDWVSIGSDTPKDVIATAYFAYSTRLVAKMAAAIGKTQDAEEYQELFEQIRAAFNKAYVTDDAKIKGQTQTCYCLGLHFNLLPDDKREAATRHLVEDVRARDWHLSTGFVGLSYLLPTLTENGRLDVAYRLLLQDTFPSWGYSIKNGATTIWERWDGWTNEKGFQDPGMNSFNHYAFGSVGRWLFGTVAGIDTDGPGYRKIVIAPNPGGGLTYARAGYDSINGRVASHWQLKGDTFRLCVTIPANTTATVYIPATEADAVTEGKTPAAAAEAVEFLRMDGDRAVFAVGSGQYHFISKLP